MQPGSFPDEYLETVFSFGLADHELPTRFVIVTACNPNGVTSDEASNRLADQKLEAELLRRGLAHFRATGGSPDGAHQEPGFGIETDLREGIELGRAFEQQAVFFIEAGDVFLVSCRSDGDRHQVGALSERVVGEAEWKTAR